MTNKVKSKLFIQQSCETKMAGQLVIPICLFDGLVEINYSLDILSSDV